MAVKEQQCGALPESCKAGFVGRTACELSPPPARQSDWRRCGKVDIGLQGVWKIPTGLNGGFWKVRSCGLVQHTLPSWLAALGFPEWKLSSGPAVTFRDSPGAWKLEESLLECSGHSLCPRKVPSAPSPSGGGEPLGDCCCYLVRATVFPVSLGLGTPACSVCFSFCRKTKKKRGRDF